MFGNLIVHHGGNLMGFSSHIAFMPQLNAGIVILTNEDHTTGTLPLLLSFNQWLLTGESGINDWITMYKQVFFWNSFYIILGVFEISFLSLFLSLIEAPRTTS